MTEAGPIADGRVVAIPTAAIRAEPPYRAFIYELVFGLAGIHALMLVLHPPVESAVAFLTFVHRWPRMSGLTTPGCVLSAQS
jgi:hypothetical protein